jgi:hypothetical protein
MMSGRGLDRADLTNRGKQLTRAHQCQWSTSEAHSVCGVRCVARKGFCPGHHSPVQPTVQPIAELGTVPGSSGRVRLDASKSAESADFGIIDLWPDRTCDRSPVPTTKLFLLTRSSNDLSFSLYDTATLYTLVRSKIRLIITHSRESKSETPPFII